MFSITDPIFHDADAARRYLEEQHWPDGPVCPHCGSRNNATLLKGKSTRPGLYKCKNGKCEKPFTVTVGTAYERSKIPLNKWLLATYLMCSSKKNISIHQLHRTLKITYKSAQFMVARIRKGMEPDHNAGPLGGEGKIVESDESFIGGKARNAHKNKPIPEKQPVQALIERDGQMRVRHITDVTAKTLRETLVTQVSRQSELHTDDALAYYWTGREFARHRAVNHSRGEYVSKDGQAHVNTCESFFAVFKRAIYGTHHAVSKAHLHRYLTEAEFKWNHRASLGIDDVQRTNAALRGIAGKRLMYKKPRSATNA